MDLKLLSGPRARGGIDGAQDLSPALRADDTEPARPRLAVPRLPGFAWKMINFVQAIYTCTWSAFWITSAILVRWVTRDTRIPLAMARRCWAPALVVVGGVRLEVEGLDRVDFSRPHCFAANHQSIFDIVALYRGLPAPLLFVLKEELLKVPFLGWYVSAMGMIVIPREKHRRSLKKLQQGRQRIAAGNSLLTFPEGTRSRDGRIGPFKPGSFVAAIDAGVPIVPVALDGPGRILPPGGFRVRPGTIRMAIGDPILTEGLERNDRRELARQVRERVVELWQGLVD